MFKIIERKQLSENVVKNVIHAPDIAVKRKAGQFVILMINEKGERIPLTIVDSDSKAGTITIIYQIVGKTTTDLAALKEGDFILNVLGPLGHATEIDNFGTAVCVGGGVGVGVIYPIAKALREAGCNVVSIIGARTKDLLILEEEMARVTDRLIVSTDDGTRGVSGRVTWPLEELLKQEGADLVVAVGPAVMMKFVSAVTRDLGVPTRVSLNSIMLDGTGMCGTCRCEVAGKTRFACVDGPEFDGHEVDWNLLLSRLDQYLEEEEIARRRT